MNARRATIADAATITATFTSAFHADPLWSWAFPDKERRPRQLATFWGLFVEGALRYPWVLVTDSCEAAATWIPPGGSELSSAEEARLAPLLEDLLGARSRLVIEVLERMEEAHPREEPHFYLSLLGTHADHRGQGLGMALLAESLSRIDAERSPTYLESTNPGNNHRYERHGFAVLSNIELPCGAPPVTTMWRAARG